MSEVMKNTIEVIKEKGKGILAADESTGTCQKRFDSINAECTFDKRMEYRNNLFSSPEMNNYVSGVILFDETFRAESSEEGVLVPEYLEKIGVMPGIKVDKGLVDFNEKEKITQGLDDLDERMAEYQKLGAKFAKWRAVYSIGESLPSDEVIKENAVRLAKYAKICQNHDIVPIVEPEVLINGDHTIEKCKEVSLVVLERLFDELKLEGVQIEYCILKPSMVISGLENDSRADRETVAKMTLEVLREMVPSSLPTINFLSGGQGPIEATEHLNLMNKEDNPWYLSFSYGRALQETALKAWGGKTENKDAMQNEFLKRAKANSLATKGEYEGE